MKTQTEIFEQILQQFFNEFEVEFTERNVPQEDYEHMQQSLADEYEEIYQIPAHMFINHCNRVC